MPFLSRQIRDLEIEVGVPLLERRARGIELTPAGRVFLDYARLALLQVETAGEAAQRVAQPEKASFVLGFLIGHEVVWLPETLRILRQESPDIEITLSSQSSPDLAGALMRGKNPKRQVTPFAVARALGIDRKTVLKYAGHLPYHPQHQPKAALAE